MVQSKIENEISGLLSDNEIIEEISKNLLISENFNSNQLSGCCYEFRVGNISYTYDYEKRITQQKVQECHIINPFETITIVTIEKVNLDSRHFLLLFSKGSLFSMGLTPVSTAADPGFRGHLGITMTNLSARPVQLNTGTGFVKGSFFKLNKNVTSMYVGQHGDATMSWPYPSQFHTNPVDFETIDASCWRFLPPPLRLTIKRLDKVEHNIKRLIGLFSLLLFLNIIVIPIKGFIPSEWYGLSERVLNITGAFASIIGLVISLGFLRSKE